MTDQYFLDRFVLDRLARRDASLRAADADRERVAERLRGAHAEGRLDLAEFQQRLESCYEAKTFGELGELVRDLPRDEPDRPRAYGWLRPLRLVPLFPLLIALIVVSAADGHHVFWLWIPILFVFWRLSWWPRRRRWAGARRGWHEPI
jgi:Domain of unknown function (DUF1707)